MMTKGRLTMTTTAHEQLIDFSQRGQRNLADAVRIWSDAVRDYTGGLGDLPAPTAAVNASFDLVEKLYDTQREFAASLYTAGVDFAEATRKAAELAANAVTSAARRAAEETERNVRTASEWATPAQG